MTTSSDKASCGGTRSAETNPQPPGQPARPGLSRYAMDADQDDSS